jgi:fatty-acyl-CoA synthase
VSDVQSRRRALEARHPVWRERTLAQALDDAAERHPGRPLILTAEREWTYSDVVAWSRRLAAGLVSRGAEAGDHVAIVMANYPEFVALKFAIARAGAVAVPINFLLKRDELAYVLEQSNASVLVTMDRFRDLDYLAALDAVHDRLPRLREVVVFSTDGAERLAQLEVSDASALAEVDRRVAAGDPRCNADIIYTSGTSGRPKGVMLTHDMLLRSAYGSAWTRAFQDGRRILFALPLYHVFSYVEGMLAALFAGGAIVPQTVFDPVATLRAVEEFAVDEALFVPTMTIAVLEAARAGSYDVSSLQTVMSAAAPAPVRLWQALRDELGVREILTAYGMTETAAATTFTQPDGPLELVATTVGTPKRGAGAGDPLVSYKTVDPLTGEDLPAGEEGELAARGLIVGHGYYNKPAETAEVLDAEGWLRSGDLGRIDADGNVLLTGRSKELYKCGGELVAPKEVEECLSSHPAVAQAYVVGVRDERMGEVGCAWVVADPGMPAPPEPEELIDWCRPRLARFKVPVHVMYLEAGELPTTATGKVQKFRLIERAEAVMA